MERDCYVVLGVPRGASDEEIKLAYRELALIHHPDRNPRNPSAAKKFMLVKEAYDVLSDPHERRLHDQELTLRAGKSWSPPPKAAAPAAAAEEPVRRRHRGLSDHQIMTRFYLVVGGLLAARGFLGAYVAPQSALLEHWLSLSRGQNEAFMLMCAGIALMLYGLGR